MLATVQKWGNSQAIRIPKNVLEALQWRVNDKVEIEIGDGKLAISKAETRQYTSLAQLFEGYEGDYVCEELDWGPPVGNEVW